MNSTTNAWRSEPAGSVPEKWFSLPLNISLSVPLARVDPRTCDII